MKTDICIISGFLGAGKTTLVDRLLWEVSDPRETVVIKSNFGEVSLDTSLIRSGGFAVRELSARCICCSLTGDFQAAILEVLREFSPKRILVEPSGVGKLSDIGSVCRFARVANMAQMRRKIVVTDVVRYRMYLDNFGEFYGDQIRHADAILFSRTEQSLDKVNRAKMLLTAIASKAQLFIGAWKPLDLSALLGGSVAHAVDCHKKNCHRDRPHEHHHHDGEYDHDHSTHEAFDTIVLFLFHTVT